MITVEVIERVLADLNIEYKRVYELQDGRFQIDWLFGWSSRVHPLDTLNNPITPDMLSEVLLKEHQTAMKSAERGCPCCKANPKRAD